MVDRCVCATLVFSFERFLITLLKECEMKQVVKSIIVVGAMLAAGSAVAMTDDVKPYIGLDYYQAWMRGTTASGTADILPRSYPGATVYVGARFMEYWGIEVGADWSARKKKTVSFGNTPFGAANLITRVRRQGVHADIVGFLPVNECFDLLGFIGFGWVKPKGNEIITVGGTTLDDESIGIKGRGVARLGVGASWMVTEMVGLRAKLGWENTRQLRFDGANSTAQRPFRDTVAMSLGAFVRW